jgi:hypothetical protein
MYIIGFLIFCLNIIVVCTCVSSTDVFLCGSSWSCIDVFVLFAFRCRVVFSPCLCSLYSGDVLCVLLCGGCGTVKYSSFFLNRIVGGEVQLGPLGTAATNRPIVPAPGDYDDGEFGGMIIVKGNRSTRRKPGSVPICPPQTPYALPGSETGPRRWEARD